jgi:branched-subunit amino acid transport protein AzlD
MRIDYATSAAILIIVAAVTAFVRAVPYLLFSGKKELPETVRNCFPLPLSYLRS